MGRKHSRTWDNTPLQQGGLISSVSAVRFGLNDSPVDGQYNCEVLARDFVWSGRCSDPRCEQDISAMPPRKRMKRQHGYDDGVRHAEQRGNAGPTTEYDITMNDTLAFYYQS